MRAADRKAPYAWYEEHLGIPSAEGSRAMPVVAVDPGDQLRESFRGVLVDPSIGSFADGRLDEALSARARWKASERFRELALKTQNAA